MRLLGRLEYDFSWNKGFCSCKEGKGFEMKLFWFRVGFKFNNEWKRR